MEEKLFNTSDRPVGVIGAMECEVALLAGLLRDREDIRIGKFTYMTGTVHGVRTVVARAGVGKVNAAVCAATMIARFDPACVINTGCMGAVDPALRQKDVVVANDTVEYDIEYGALGSPAGLIFLPDGTETGVFECDKRLLSLLCAAVESRGLTAHRGRIASGDRFVSESAAREQLRERFGASGCEMEGAAIAHACVLAGVPFGLVRSVSDLADGSAGTGFAEFAVEASVISAGIVSAFVASL